MSDDQLTINEIRDYIHRAPKRRFYDGKSIVNTTAARFKWLSEIARGTLNERINRRAGISDSWKPFHNPVFSAVRRNHRKKLRIEGKRCLAHLI